MIASNWGEVTAGSSRGVIVPVARAASLICGYGKHVTFDALESFLS